MAATLFYTDAASFNAAEPGLPVETFSAANLFGQPEALQTSPLDSATNDSVFAPGSILAGLTISNLNPLNTPGLIVYAGGIGGSKSVGNNWFGDSLVLTFTPGVSAVGANVFANTSPGPSLAGSFTERVYNGSTLLGSTTFSGTQGSIAYIGVSSTTPITSVRLLYTTDDATTFATNVAFGTAATSTPEPSSLILFAAAGAVLGIGLWRRRGCANTIR